MACSGAAPRLLFLYPRNVRKVFYAAEGSRSQLPIALLSSTASSSIISGPLAKSAQKQQQEQPSSYHDALHNKQRFSRHDNITTSSRSSDAKRGSPITSASRKCRYPFQHHAEFHTSAFRRQTLRPQRYGKANEPPPFLDDKKNKDRDKDKGVKSSEDGARGDVEIGNGKDGDRSRTVGKDNLGEKAKDGGLMGTAIDVTPTKKKGNRGTKPEHEAKTDIDILKNKDSDQASQAASSSSSPSSVPKTTATSTSTSKPRVRNGSVTLQAKSSPDQADSEFRDVDVDVDVDGEGEGGSPPSSKGPLFQASQSSNPAAEDADDGSLPSSKQLLLRRSQSPAATHLAPSSSASRPYIHHFDTYTMARNLQDGGFSERQAVTTMKAMRLTLAENLTWAGRRLVSKSNVENDTYLFRAACSELRTEVQHNRKTSADCMRNDRSQLEHEADILNQRVNQETLNLKDELKGMLDDRKMQVRMEQKEMENKIQELDYRITVALRSDARSAVEGLRWILVRRAAIALAVLALMILATLKYSSYMTHTQEIERQKLKESLNAASHRQIQNQNQSDDNSPRSDMSQVEDQAQAQNNNGDEEEILARTQDSDGPGYVSLG